MKINQFEPKISKKDKQAVNKYLNSGGWLTENKLSKDLEQKVASYVKRKYAVAVPNGTQAIYLSLLSADIKKGSVVAVPNLTMIATINAIIWAGATPYIVDTDEKLCMDIEKLKKIKNLDAVIYVPLNGRTTNGINIETWCRKNGIKVIEDSAHALGSRYENNKMCGSLGDLSVFSFTPHKIITMGQGGMVLTDNKKMYEKLFNLKTFNRMKNKSDWHDGFGLNFKITDLQASIGLSQFEQLNSFISIKKKNYLKLKEMINNPQVKVNQFEDYETPWFYDVKFKTKSKRNRFVSYMSENNIETRLHYPCLSQQKYLKDIKSTNTQYSEVESEKLVWLPSSTNLKDSDIKLIVKSINNFK
jgi:perosamine synthetase